MGRYKIVESVKRHELHAIHRYEDLGIHHPTANAAGIQDGRLDELELRRVHKIVDGRFEEVRPLSEDRMLIKKDFVLSHDGHGPVRIPSPAEGYVHYLHDKTATVRIYDRPFGTPGAKLLTQVLHMEPDSFHLKEGASVAYGQPLGAMGDTGTPRVFHAHVEAEPSQFRRYIRDIDSGVITPDSYPALSTTRTNLSRKPAELPPTHAKSHDVSGPHAVQPTVPQKHEALHLDDIGMQVSELQQMLSSLGYRNPKGHPLVIDNTLGPNTRHAIESFQRAHHLHVDGVVGKDTWAALVDAQHAPLLSEATHSQHLLYVQILRGIRKLPEGTYRSEQERTHAAIALTISAHVEGLRNIDHVALGRDGINLFAVQGRMDDPAHRRVHVDHVQAMSQSAGYDIPARQVSQVQQPLHAMHAMQSLIEQHGAVMGISR